MKQVEVVLTNRWAYFPSCSQKMGKKLQKCYSYFPKGYRFSPKFKAGVWDGRIKLMKYGKVPVGLFLSTRQEVEEKLSIQFDVMIDRICVEYIDHVYDTDSKYGYQGKCIRKMLRALKRGGGLVLSATGTGKTAIAGKFFKCIPDYSLLFVVDTIDLLYQSQKELRQWTQESIGIVGNSEYQPQRITVATIQTLKKHSKKPQFRKWFSGLEVVIVDEIHDQLAKRNFSLMTTIDPFAVYGLTATLALTKKDVRYRAYSFCGPVVFEFPLSEGVKNKVLTKGRVLQLLFPEKYQGEFRSYQEEYEDEVLDNKLKHNTLMKIIDMLAVKGDKHVMVIGNRVQHVKGISERLTVPHALVWGGVKKQNRVAARQEFEDSKIKVIVTNGVFKKGVSINAVDSMVDIAEFKSKGDAMQKFGRGVRLNKGKTELLYIDYGTQTGRFSQAARSRTRAFTAAGIEVKKVKVHTVQEAVTAVKKWVSGR